MNISELCIPAGISILIVGLYVLMWSPLIKLVRMGGADRSAAICCALCMTCLVAIVLIYIWKEMLR